jgi:hypothetical protein
MIERALLMGGKHKGSCWEGVGGGSDDREGWD